MPSFAVLPGSVVANSKIQRGTMKKVTTIITACLATLALTLGATACGSSDTTTTTPAATTTAPAVTTTAPTTTQQNNPQGDCPDGQQYDAATGNCYPDGQKIPE